MTMQYRFAGIEEAIKTAHGMYRIVVKLAKNGTCSSLLPPACAIGDKKYQRKMSKDEVVLSSNLSTMDLEKSFFNRDCLPPIHRATIPSREETVT